MKKSNKSVEYAGWMVSRLTTAKMAASIKLFQFLRKFHQIMGIHPSQPNQKRRLINLRITICIGCFVQEIITTAAFLFFDARSMFDYGFVSFVLITSVAAIIFFLIFNWQSENTLAFIKNCEEFITKRKQISKYPLMNARGSLWCTY